MQVKRMMKVATLALGLAAMAVGLPGAAAGEPKADKTAKGKKVCRSLVPSGTRFPTRVCRTKEEWAELQDKSQSGLLDYQRNNSTASEGQNGPR